MLFHGVHYANCGERLLYRLQATDEAGAEIRPFRIDIPQTSTTCMTDAQHSLGQRVALDASGPPTGPVPPGWEYGVPLDPVKNLVEATGGPAATGRPGSEAELLPARVVHHRRSNIPLP